MSKKVLIQLGNSNDGWVTVGKIEAVSEETMAAILIWLQLGVEKAGAIVRLEKVDE